MIFSFNTIGWIALIAGFCVASWTITKRFLHFFQQEEYDARRFLYWWIASNSFERRATIFALIFTLCSLYLIPESYFLFMAASCLFASIIALFGATNRPANTKKPLVMTARATRIFTLAIGLQIFSLIFGSTYFASALNQYCTLPYLPVTLFFIALSFILVPMFIVIANGLLVPYESLNQKKFYKEAQAILLDRDTVLIGITGSYGKTSIKQILAHILNAHAPTLATPGSVNTVMGIARIIREKLTRDHEYFIVEMGAYGVGSIQRLCQFTPPKVGIVTAVGVAHFERFKSQKTIFEAKSELPQALPEDGFVILNGDDPFCRRMAERTKAKALFYGTDRDAGALDCCLSDYELTADGIRCCFEYQDGSHQVTLPIYGLHQAMNAAGAFLTAMQLGVAPLTAIAALKSMPPIDHRLVVQKSAGGVTIIDDAYNSNPTGFENALDVLRILPGQRKILVTPGMVELGDREDAEHQRLAPKIAESCDIICLVAPQRVQSLVDALTQQVQGDGLKLFSTLQEAREFLNQNLKPGDVVLYENDLPDLYESRQAFRLF
ncbi:MAG: UDP-N-acetylmuramoyl-tripeptide--D-alanyl-D-alanine ligase [Candidatus Hinthialibacter antarcticus]|nr:UDP-N-acetylmuramoyl-tripeptide--D-alanyl-D-alanine ligase [Candidatus Hinthialibacter antarcticus]